MCSCTLPCDACFSPFDPSGFNELLDEYSLHQFIVRKGVTLTETPEFASYQRTFRSKWGAIEIVIQCVLVPSCGPPACVFMACSQPRRSLEKLARDFKIPTMYVDGRKVADVAADDILCANLTIPVLLACIANVDQVTCCPSPHPDPSAIRCQPSQLRALFTSAIRRWRRM